jgi:hypothetical protein
VPAGGIHEELERVERARRRGSSFLLGSRCAHDDVALFQRDAEGGDLVLLELVLVRQRFDLLLLDEAALGGLLEQALGRRQVMQMNRLAQLNPFRFEVRGRPGRRPPGVQACSGIPYASRETPVLLFVL